MTRPKPKRPKKPQEQHPKRAENPKAKCPRHQRKEWRPLVEMAWKAGWWCEQRRKYIYCYAPNRVDIVKIPITPSSARTLRNKKRDFAAAGLEM
jgi:hypothetical protein